MSDDETLPEVGFAGSDPDLISASGQALDGLAAVVPFAMEADTLDASLGGLESVLLPVAAPLEAPLAFLARFRENNPLVPIVVLAGAGVDANLAVELVKCGADDALTVPFEPDILRAKLRRILERREGPTLNVPALAPLAEVVDPQPRARAATRSGNRRRCFRATIRPDLAPRVTLLLGSHALMVRALDLSLNSPDSAGGMLMAVPRELARAVPKALWKTGAQVSLEILIPGESDPVLTTAKLIGNRRGAGVHDVRFAVMFGAQDHDIQRKLRGYWVSLQRRPR